VSADPSTLFRKLQRDEGRAVREAAARFARFQSLGDGHELVLDVA